MSNPALTTNAARRTTWTEAAVGDLTTILHSTSRQFFVLSAGLLVLLVSCGEPTANGPEEMDESGLTALPGNTNDPAVEAVPELDFSPDPTDYAPDAEFAGLATSLRTVILMMAPNASVGDINSLLDEAGAQIVGGIGAGTGILLLRVPPQSHQTMAELVSDLAGKDAVSEAVPDVQLDVQMQPSAESAPAGWSWERIPSGGNWGLELCRFPQMWNLNRAVAKLDHPGTLVGVSDRGFHPHEDLTFLMNLTPQERDDHGTHVAGTIGAGFNNGLGIDGATPFAHLQVIGGPLTAGTNLQSIDKLATFGARIINMSLGLPLTSHPDDSPGLTAFTRTLGQVFKDIHESLLVDGGPPLIVVGSGNDSERFANPVPARFSSPAAWAGLELGSDHVIVVEAIEQADVPEGARRAPYSNPGGDVSAPGTAVLSTVNGNGYAEIDGTSMAAAHVSGLAAYLLAIQPNLTNTQLRQLLIAASVPVAETDGVAAADRIDAFASAMDIDLLEDSDNAVLSMLLDIDDGTLDGNRRVRPDDPSVDFTDEDADGDGNLDMADFRRWRDWMLEATQAPGLSLDGSAGHPKRDLNGNGIVEAPLIEATYARGDFNGDGLTDDVNAAAVPGAFRIFDLVRDDEVLSLGFADDFYSADELRGLIHSGDIRIDAGRLLNSGGFARVVSTVAVGDELHEIEYSASDPAFVYTLPAPGEYEVEVFGLDAVGDTLCIERNTFTLAIAQDRYWTPSCGGLAVEITLAERIEAGTASPLQIRAGVIQQDGAVSYQAGIDLAILATGGSVAQTGGVTVADGFFSTEVTMAENSPQLNVFVTATAGADTTVATATALPFGSAGVRATLTSFYVGAGAIANIGSASDEMDDTDSGEFPNVSSFGGAASAGAASGDGTNSANSSATASLQGSATWSQTDVLTSLSVSIEASANAQTTGPSTQAWNCKASAEGIMTLEFDVGSGGIQLQSSVSEWGRVLLRERNGSIWSVVYRSSVDETVTLDLAAGRYQIRVDHTSASAASGPPPDSDASTVFAAADLEFSVPTSER